jgi:alpha-L-rhamnosidase
MMSRRWWVVSAVAIVGLPSLAGRAMAPDGLQPIALRVEYLVNPLAVQERQPRFSWQFTESGRRGVKQTAYRILVASQPGLLAAGRGDLWDSGKVSSTESIQIAYAGRPLSSRQRCFWHVQVWDETDRLSAPSQQSEWTVGLLEKSDWTAQWIGDAAPSVDDVSATYARRTFAVTAPVKRAVAYASALGLYELRINGQRAGNHQLAPEWTDYNTRVQYQAYDVTTLLRTGDNAVGAVLADGWYAGGVGLAQGLIRKARTIYGTSPRLLVGSKSTTKRARRRRRDDGGWRVMRPASGCRHPQHRACDARRDMPGWDAPASTTRPGTTPTGGARGRPSPGRDRNEPIRTQELAPIG